MADKRTYEVVFIIDPTVGDDEVMRLSEAVQKIITGQGGTITKTEIMGKRQLAYEINHKKDGTYVLLEVEGSGAEIAELERRMRVNDQILRYMTIRVDEDRRRADKLRDRRARKAARRTGAKNKASGAGATANAAAADTEDAEA
ncbi:MAG: small subunit ribosomal protein [Blastocatellia bacterium]|nr:small subunit ribosomal protein [Blastocatellia bacterium]